MKKKWTIAIALQMWTSLGQKATRGIVDYGNAHPGFRFRDIIFSEDEEVPYKLSRLTCDGAIINLTKIAFLEIKERFPEDVVLVNIGDDLVSEKIGTVTGIRGSGSRILLDHFRQQGYRRFAYIGPEEEKAKNLRASNLRDLLEDSEGSLGVFSLPGSGPFDEESPGLRKLGDWLKDFLNDSGRTGILAYDGHRATAVITGCGKLGVRVPEQVGVASYIEEQTCLTAEIPITSTEPPAHEQGYAAMKLLHEQLRSRRPRARLIELGEPILLARGSTTVTRDERSDIAAAVRFMEKHLEKNLTVDAVVRHLGTMSRAKFYRSFSKQMGMNPAEYIRSLRIERAKELLSGTSISITRIAGMCGFVNLTQFGETFKRHAGKTPREYRQGRKKSALKKGA